MARARAPATPLVETPTVHIRQPCAQRELPLVSRFRSSHHCAAHSFANFGIKGTLAIYDSGAGFGFEVPTQARGYNDRNFKSTALGARRRHEAASPSGIARVGSASSRSREDTERAVRAAVSDHAGCEFRTPGWLWLTMRAVAIHQNCCTMAPLLNSASRGDESLKFHL